MLDEAVLSAVTRGLLGWSGGGQPAQLVGALRATHSGTASRGR